MQMEIIQLIYMNLNKKYHNKKMIYQNNNKQSININKLLKHLQNN